MSVAASPAPAGGGARIDLRGVTRRYGSLTVVTGVDLTIEAGEFFTLLGPSGSGKTTLLMMLAGFLDPEAGEIRLGDRPMAGVPAHRRSIGMVFQSYALFPHMTVQENVAYPLRIRKVPEAEVAQRVEAMLKLVGLGNLGRRYPRMLSGGQQQRVALARALVYRPPVLLMDEPLGALDKKLRQEMQMEIKRIHAATGTTVVYVTHDQEEALTMSDRIGVMHEGRLAQVGTPRQLYEEPVSPFVAGFLGDSNFLSGEAESTADGRLTAVLPGGRRISGVAVRGGGAAQKVVLSFRPEAARFAPARTGENEWQGTVTDVIFVGDAVRYSVCGPGEDSLIVKRPAAETGPGVGQAVTVSWPMAVTRAYTEV